MSQILHVPSSDVARVVETLVAAVGLQVDLPKSAPVHLEELERRLHGEPATYVSTPITTGLSLLRWRAHARDGGSENNNGEAEVKSRVMRENRAALEPLLQALNMRAGRVIIDPTELSEAQWKQGDYHRYWIEVIARFAGDVVFADGWNYSTGCSIEYAAAHLLRLPTYDSSLRPLPSSKAAQLLHEGAVIVEAASSDATALRAAAGVIEAC